MISTLPFDSNLFNYPVGKTSLGELWDEHEFLEEARDYQLVYIFSETALVITNPAIQLVDTKLTFQKSLEPLSKPIEIQHFECSLLEEELFDLAFLSGKYSRFKTDSRLQNLEFDKLYRLWIKNAFEKNQVIVAPENTGMVTYSIEKELGRIGLIAVSEKCQGQGLGKKLVKAAEFLCLHKGAKYLQIPTQEANIPACRLYTSLGYEPAEKSYVYHWWKSFE
ncbi:GNAT family N-acetyltransferase [Algoriphagus chordae]|uniref:Acetyltransferase (GNAT) family protein n=1 Tax=Algoriphagus chordae TaxID=237019 RepID=A0A2W7QHC5_9BACT|nr:GNAT family N-acetyltransferase [Algoriphagus chordae]PZX47653.1 acetyltransferase (GNAT) family protein [Algoriphagus chordae]